MTPIGMGLGARAALGYGLGVSAPGGALPAWWYVAGKTCLGAWSPKGAASYAASKINLANPGTNDAAEGTAPAFNTATGWTFLAANATKLTTGITWSQTYTAIVRTNSPNVGGAVIGATSAGAALMLIQSYRSDAKVGYWNGVGLLIAPHITVDAVLAIAGNTAYRNGVAETGTIAAAAGAWNTVWIGAASSTYQLYNGSVLAVAIYSDTLSAANVAAVSAAMAAL